MDIVAESLSANLLKARNVTVSGQDVLKWFESKLSASVSFVGAFDDLSAAPPRNGAVAIVGSKDYIYSSTTSAWQEFGDEGQIGALTQAVAALSGGISGKQDKISVDGILSCDGDGIIAAAKMPQNISDLSNDVGYLSVESEPAFAAVSATFLTAHQNLSGYYLKTETSSSGEISAALRAIVSAEDFSTALSGKTYQYDSGTAWMANALVDIISAMGGVVEGFPG